MSRKQRSLLALIGPGILVAATGVGAGDLATASFTGSVLGLTILWAVVVGAFLKFVLNEGLARWQLATGNTLLEGCVEHFGAPVRWIFLCYLVVWSFLVGAALMSAVGVTCLAVYAPFQAAHVNKIFYGAMHSAIAVVLVKAGGYRLFRTCHGRLHCSNVRRRRDHRRCSAAGARRGGPRTGCGRRFRPLKGV